MTSRGLKIIPILVLLGAWAVFILPMLWMRSHAQWMTGGVVAIAFVLIWADFLQFGSKLGFRGGGGHSPGQSTPGEGRSASDVYGGK